MAEIKGTSVGLGSHIKLKLQPATIFAHILTGVQRSALKILARRIKEHSLAAETRINMQHGKKGKYRYYLWLSADQMQNITVDQLFDRLLKITKYTKRAVTILIKQKIIHGPIHNIWDTNYSLL